MIVNRIAKSTGSLAVYYPDTGQVCQIGIVKIFVQLGQSLIYSLTQQIDFCGDGSGF